MRALAIGLLGAVLILTAPIPTLAIGQTKHHHRHTVRTHHWFWQHWHHNHRKR